MSNLKLKNIFVCENVIVSQNGQPSLINLVSEINSTAFPAIHPRITVLTTISGDAGIYNEKIELVSINDSSIVNSVNNRIEVPEGGVSNFIGNFVNVIFPKEGKYWFKITVNAIVLSEDKEDSYIELKKI